MEKLAANHLPQILDVLGARLAFERTGVRLYDSVIQKVERGADPRYQRMLDKLRDIRAEEKEHEEWLEAQIRSLGGDAHAETTLAKLEAEEAQGITHIIIDGHDDVLHVLHALLAAELADNAGWDLLVKLADETGDREAQRGFRRRLVEEMDHLAFVREAVIRAAEIEILGREGVLPTGTRSAVERAVKRPFRLGLGGLLVATGAALGSGILLARRRLGGLRRYAAAR